MTTPSPDNEQMAELGIRELYKHVRKSEPEAIVWCDSPYQLAVIPHMVTNILLSPAWTRLMRELRKARRDKLAWEAAWKEGWQRLRNGQVEFLVDHVLFYSNLRPVSAETKANLLRSLEAALRKIAWEDKVHASSIKPGKPDKFQQVAAPVDSRFLQTGYGLVWKVQQQLIDLALDWNLKSALSRFLGVFDPRPKQRKPQLSEQVTKELLEVHQLCTPIERFGVEMFQWLEDGITHVHTTVAMPNPQLSSSVIWAAYFVSAWLPFATSAMFIEPNLFADVQLELEAWSDLTHGAFAYHFANNICYVCRKPTTFDFSDLRRPHRADGPAASWNDGFEIYAWKGIVLERAAIMDPDHITIGVINEAQNAEIRRSLIEIYGESRFLIDAKAKIVHSDECGTLFRMFLPGDEALVMVRVRNSTAEPDGTYKHYFLRVPPTIRRAREAVAWTFNLKESEYQPEHQT